MHGVWQCCKFNSWCAFSAAHVVLQLLQRAALQHAQKCRAAYGGAAIMTDGLEMVRAHSEQHAVHAAAAASLIIIVAVAIQFRDTAGRTTLGALGDAAAKQQ